MRVWRELRVVLMSFGLCWIGPVFAAPPLELFLCAKGAHYKFVPDYAALVSKIVPGTRIDLCTKVVTVKEILGEGNTAKIFLLRGKEPQALRLPIKASLSDYVDETVEGSKVLSKYGAPHVRVLDYKPDSWSIVEALTKGDQITIEKFQTRFKTTNPRHQMMMKKLEEFAIETAPFTSFPDVHGKNLVFSVEQARWLILDWRWEYMMKEREVLVDFEDLKMDIEYFLESEDTLLSRFDTHRSSEFDRALGEIRRKVNAYRLEFYRQSGKPRSFKAERWLEFKRKKTCGKLLTAR